MSDDTYIRVFCFSSDVFGGFTCRVDVEEISSVEEIESLCLSVLLQHLNEYNFLMLEKLATQRDFHIHDITLEMVKNGTPGQIFYICDECHQ